MDKIGVVVLPALKAKEREEFPIAGVIFQWEENFSRQKNHLPLLILPGFDLGVGIFNSPERDNEQLS